MADETPKLARCPFVKCGGEAEQIVAGDDCYYTYCVECGIQSPSFTSAASAAEWWNRRASQAGGEISQSIPPQQVTDAASDLVEDWERWDGINGGDLLEWGFRRGVEWAYLRDSEPEAAK